MLSKMSEKAKNHMVSSYVGYKTEIHRHRQQYGGYQWEEGWEPVKGKGSQTYGGRIFAFGWWSMQYADDIS